MIVPSKFTPFKNSVVSRIPCLLDALSQEEGGLFVYELYRRTESSFEDVGEFILALDSLFVLGRVQLDKSTGVIGVC